jgi:flagellar biogenesis protein FliO
MATGDDYRPDDPDEFPEEQLAADEAPTPSWMPLLGIVIALVVLFAWLVTRPVGKTEKELATDAAATQPAPSAEPSGE